MGRIPEQTIKKIMDYSDIVSLISEFVPLKKTGRNYMGVCPFHGDKGPSLSVSADKQVFHCFGCGAAGNAVGFIMKLRNLEYIDAVKYLAERANIEIEEEEENPKKAAERRHQEMLYQMNIDAARFFYSNLKRNQSAYQYLSDRSLDEKNIKKFGLGFSLPSWDSLLSYLTQKGYTAEAISQLGLVIKDTKRADHYYDRFRNRIIFPVFDIKNHVIGFGGRVMDDSKPKYLNSPESPLFTKGTNLYGLNFAVKSGIPDKLVIVEGYMDCITLHQYDIPYACASLGTALTREQAKLLRRYTRNIYICYDADSAGKAATLRGLEILAGADCDVRIITIPRGKDPDEFIKQNGRDAFLSLIDHAIPIVEYRIGRTRENYNLKDPNQKGKFIQEVSTILSGIDNEVEAQGYATRVFDETGVDMRTLMHSIEKAREKKSDHGHTGANNNDRDQGTMAYDLRQETGSTMEYAYKKAELLLLRASLQNKEHFNYIQSQIDLSDFITEAYRYSAEIVFEALSHDKAVNRNDLINNASNSSDMSDITKLFLEENLDIDKDLMDDLIHTLKKTNLENKIIETTVDIKKCEEMRDYKKSAELMKDLMQLQKALTKL